MTGPPPGRRELAYGIRKRLTHEALYNARFDIISDTLADMQQELVMHVVLEVPQLDGEEDTLP